MAIAGSEVSSSAWTMKRASRALYEIANDDLGDRPEVRSDVETIAKDLATAADGSTSAASDDASAASASATVRIPAVYAGVFVRRAAELRTSAVETECLGPEDEMEEAARSAVAILRVLNQVENSGSGDLDLTAPADLLRRLLGWCIPNDAENIASIWDGPRDGEMRQLAERLLFWIKTREALGGEAAAEVADGRRDG